MNPPPLPNRPAKRFSLAGLLLLAALLPACYRPTQSTVDIAIPQMRSESCAYMAAEPLRGMAGIERVNIALEQKALQVTYDNTKLGLRNLERAIALAGFDANDTPADPSARQRLPEGCR